MKRWMTGLVCASLVAFPAGRAAAQASVEGRVPLPKRAAEPVPRPRYSTQVVHPAALEPPTAVVFLEGDFPKASTNAPPVRRVGQKDLRFIPYLLPIQRGTAVEFPNEDDFYHNVFSYSKPKRFDLGRYRKEESPPPQVFPEPGLVKLNCEIHDHMRGLILVLDTPHFVKTDTNGHFRLENLPAGKFILKAWLNEKTTLERPVELKAGETARVEFTDK